MNISINFHDNGTITADFTDYNAESLAQKLNDPQITMITVGNVVINKGNIKSILPETPTDNPNVNVYLNDGITVPVFIESYDANDVAVDLNNQKKVVVDLGELIVHRNGVKMIAPVQ
ncbi:hypothetical protein KYJ26_14290 [Bacillus sp. MCCB 382]|uniref:hypothetical protein n=1 Tax=Bacillus sp. MCCB 382 TaxID=2860197 RepID=UPI001C57EF95|nr:hypothetical protein [Bacillus sp. MCCB 382]